jgi:hypothetical protein
MRRREFIAGLGAAASPAICPLAAMAQQRSVRTVRRHQARYVQGGMAGLGREEGWRRGRRRISGRLMEMRRQGFDDRVMEGPQNIRQEFLLPAPRSGARGS